MQNTCSSVTLVVMELVVNMRFHVFDFNLHVEHVLRDYKLRQFKGDINTFLKAMTSLIRLIKLRQDFCK